MAQARFFNASKLLSVMVVAAAVTGCARTDGGAPVYWSSGWPGPQRPAPATGPGAATPPAAAPAVVANPLPPVQASSPSRSSVVRIASPAAEPALPQGAVVKVRQGDTLYRIAKTHNLTVDELARYNGIEPPYRLAVGQRIVIPSAASYVVRRGDTLYSIARRYGVNVRELASVNNVPAPYTIKVGQQLEVPVGLTTAGIASSATALRPSAPAGRTPPRVLPPVKRDEGFLWPVKGRVISSYGVKKNGLHNDGINISAALGAPVHAAKSGVVTYAGSELKGYGKLLLIKHDDGFITAYAHNRRLLVKRGDYVHQGDVIAEAGDTGAVSSPQVHFEIRKGRKSLNPMDYLTGA